MKIKLFNRDGADLYLEKIGDRDPEISTWQLKVDDKHSYCLKYMRAIFDESNRFIESVDPSGGPLISVGEVFEKKYKIIEIRGYTEFIIDEGISKD